MAKNLTLPDVPPDLSAFQAQSVQASFTYTPPNWDSKHKALYAITFDASNSPLYEANFGPGFNPTTQTVMFVFDAITRAQHNLTSLITQHPVQSGYNITDHVIMQPFSLTLEVAMSDAIASYSLPAFTPMWSSNPSKSISAFQQMKLLMEQRQIMTLNTRLYTYRNMALQEVTVEESAQTYFGGLAMVLTFQQIIVADIAVLKDSRRIQTIGDTKEGTVNGTVPSATTIQQHQIPSYSLDFLKKLKPPPLNVDVYTHRPVPGAGSFTSPVLSQIYSRMP